MKLHSLIICLVLGAAVIASAQTAAPGQPTQAKPTSITVTAATTVLSNTAEHGPLHNLRLLPGTLPQVVEQLQGACTKAAAEKGWSRETAEENIRKAKALVQQADAKAQHDGEWGIASEELSKAQALAKEAKAVVRPKGAMEAVEADFQQADVAYQRLVRLAQETPKLATQQELDDAKAKRDATNRTLGAARQETARQETAEANLSRAQALFAQTKAKVTAEREAAGEALREALEFVMPTVTYGPGTSEAKISAALDLADVRLLDALALIAAAAGCDLNPIYALPQEGKAGQRLIGYRFSLPSDRALSPSPTTGGDVGGGESGAGDQLTGIGVALGQKDGYIVVAQVIPGSPADRYHCFKPGDRILQVAEMGQEWVDVTGLPLEKVTKMIRGKPGSSVRLAIDPIAGGVLPQFFGGGGIYFLALEREKLDLSPPKALIPKVTEVNVPDLNVASVTGLDYFVPNDALPPKGGKAGDPVKHPTPAASPDEDDVQTVRIYATGSMLSGNDQGVKEAEFTMLVTQAIDLAGLAKRGAPQLYFHAKSRVLIARASARGHEIIEQLVNALRKGDEGLPPNPPKP